MKTRLLSTICALIVSTAAWAEGSYSNAPAGHDTPPVKGNSRYPAASKSSRVPTSSSVGRVPTGTAAKPAAKGSAGNFLASPQGSDSTPFGGIPDDVAAAIEETPPAPAAPVRPKPVAVAPKPLAPKPVVPKPQPRVTEPPPRFTEPPSPAGDFVAQPDPAPPSPVRTPSEAVQLVEVFSVEQNPGVGYLEYTRAGATERVDFGAAPGHFAVGLVFRGEFLPDQMGREFKRKNIIQIAFGTLRSRLQGQTPQFGALSIIADSMIDYPSRYMLKMPTGQTNNPETGGLMLFTSPATPVEQSDEEKLKSTYFSQNGSLNLVPEGKAKVIDIRSQGRRLTYRMQLMRLEMSAKLVTPFNATEAGLKGTVEFPIYYSEDRAGDLLAKQISRESFSSTGGILIQEDPADPKREPAARKRKPTKRKTQRRDDEDDSR